MRPTAAARIIPLDVLKLEEKVDKFMDNKIETKTRKMRLKSCEISPKHDLISPE